jgi:hypothetical protein
LNFNWFKKKPDPRAFLFGIFEDHCLDCLLANRTEFAGFVGLHPAILHRAEYPFGHVTASFKDPGF